jgi:type II secretory pathway pseudopilin PulG
MKNGRPTNHTVAFTLVEVVVAEAIFLILLLVVVQLIFSALQTTATQKKRMDELGDARQSLDRLSLDWVNRVRRNDIYASFSRQTASSTNAANAQVSFFSQVQAYSGARHLAWVTYAVNNVEQVTQGSQSVTAPGLERGVVGYNWSANDSSGTANPLMVFPPQTPSVASTFDPLANTVFRFDYCFIQQVPAPSTATTTSAFTTNSALTLTSTNLVGIVVAVASLDQQSRQILNQAQLVELGNALPAIADGQTPQAQWVNTINNGTFAATARSSGIPASAANAVHVYQRILYVND